MNETTFTLLGEFSGWYVAWAFFAGLFGFASFVVMVCMWGFAEDRKVMGMGYLTAILVGLFPMGITAANIANGEQDRLDRAVTAAALEEILPSDLTATDNAKIAEYVQGSTGWHSEGPKPLELSSGTLVTTILEDAETNNVIVAFEEKDVA